MKNHYAFFLFFSFLVSLFACNKDNPTVINLTVVDYFTGIPLEGVEYGLIASYRKPNPPLDDIKWSKPQKTGADGKINYTFSSDESGNVVDFQKEGYLSKGTAGPIYNGKYNEFLVKMHPFDATLKLEIKNQNATEDSLYLVIQNTTINTETPGNIKGHLLGFPTIIHTLEHATFYVPTLANEPLSIYWSWDKMDKYKPAPLQDQLTINKGDTLVYSISN